MEDFGSALQPEVVDFVEQHVESLLAWDLVVFFHRNATEVLDVETLATRLGRAAGELEPEVDALCEAGVLQSAGGLVRYRPDPSLHHTIEAFVEACRDRSHRLALIALVLQKVNPHFQG